MAPKRSNDQKEEEDKKSSGSGRVIAVLSAEGATFFPLLVSSRCKLTFLFAGYTGSSVIELLYSDGKYSDKFDKLVGITFGEATSPDVKAIHEEYSVETVSIDDVDEEYLKSNSIDTALIIPPARKVRHFFSLPPFQADPDLFPLAGQARNRQELPRDGQEGPKREERRPPLCRRRRVRW
jgi:hypothetical protein